MRFTDNLKQAITVVVVTINTPQMGFTDKFFTIEQNMKKKNIYIKQFFHIPSPTILQLDREGQQRNHRKREPWVTGQGVRYNILHKMKEYMADKGYEDLLEKYHFAYEQKKGDTFSQSIAFREPNPAYLWNFVGGWMQAKGGNKPTLKHQSHFATDTFAGVSKGSAECVFSDMEIIGSRVGSDVAVKTKGKNAKGKDETVWEEYEKYIQENPKLGESLKAKHEGQSHPVVGDNGKKLYAKGVFQNNVEIDLERFMRVNKISCEEEAYDECIENGWIEHTSDKIEGDSFIVPPKEIAELLIDALAYSILSWGFVSNQSRTATELNRVGVALSYSAGSVRNFYDYNVEEGKFIIWDDNFGNIDDVVEGAMYPYSNVEFFLNTGVGLNLFDEKMKESATPTAFNQAFSKLTNTLKDSITELY